MWVRSPLAYGLTLKPLLHRFLERLHFRLVPEPILFLLRLPRLLIPLHLLVLRLQLLLVDDLARMNVQQRQVWLHCGDIELLAATIWVGSNAAIGHSHGRSA